MDLAKIRKKSLEPVEETVIKQVTAPMVSSERAYETLQTVTAFPSSSEVEPVRKDYLPPPSAAPVTATPYFESTMLQNFTETRTPLEAILAGRAAAGCDDESLVADDGIHEARADSGLEFLCFRVSDEIYGINIMDIKEIIKPREVTEVPRAPVFVSGVLSLRGTIIPIIDMRIRLDLARGERTGKERVIVVKNASSFSGLLVDEVIQVVRVQIDTFEATPTVLDGIDRDFISGIGRSDGRLIIILNLENIADINLY